VETVIIVVNEQCLKKVVFCVQLDVAYAMEYLHALRPAIIHRDLKSHNVLRAFNGVMKVCDFGLVTTKTAQAGTPAYMAPGKLLFMVDCSRMVTELYSCAELIDGRSFNKSVDVYAFGILLWEILARQVPFYMVELYDLYDRVKAGDRPRLSSAACSRQCSNLISDCWYEIELFLSSVAVLLD
jgi:serine/threonine protein kinase